MKDRAARVGRAMQQALAELIEHGAVKDPRVAGAGMITVTEVRPSADLRSARVYVSVFADEKVRAAALEGLRHAAGFLRREVGRALGLRSFPDLSFRLDDSIERGARIEGILKEIKGE